MNRNRNRKKEVNNMEWKMFKILPCVNFKPNWEFKCNQIIFFFVFFAFQKSILLRLLLFLFIFIFYSFSIPCLNEKKSKYLFEER